MCLCTTEDFIYNTYMTTAIESSGYVSLFFNCLFVHNCKYVLQGNLLNDNHRNTEKIDNFISDIAIILNINFKEIRFHQPCY